MIDSQHFHLAAGPSRKETVDRLLALLPRLPVDKAWSVEIRLHKARRSNDQNALLWSIYAQILKKGGPDMAGWDKNDLHTFFLINHFGSEIKTVFGRPRHRPLRTSSGLNKQDMSDYIDSIVRFMAERGVALELPGEQDPW